MLQTWSYGSDKYQEHRWWVFLIYFVILAILIYYKIMDRAELPTSLRDLGKWVLGFIGLLFVLYVTWLIANYGH